MQPSAAEVPESAPAAAPAPAEAHSAKPSIEETVDAWFRTHFHGLAGSLHDGFYNHAHAAKEELKQLLAAL